MKRSERTKEEQEKQAIKLKSLKLGLIYNKSAKTASRRSRPT